MKLFGVDFEREERLAHNLSQQALNTQTDRDQKKRRCVWMNYIRLRVAIHGA